MFQRRPAPGEAGGGLRLAGSIVYGDREGESVSAALPLASGTIRNLIFSQVASNPEYFTGIAILNPGETTATIKMEVCDNKGSVLASTREVLLAHARRAGVLTGLFPELAGEDLHSGYVRITSDAGLVACALFGTNSLSALSAIPASGY